MVDVAIIGATGYGGIELIRLLDTHPLVRLSYLTTETYVGERVCDVYPHLTHIELPLEKLDPTAVARCDFALVAIPAGLSMELVPGFLDAGVRVIDISPDFRLRDPLVYKHWYSLEHTSADLLQQAVFGVPELHREAIKAADLVAAAGCYSTSALLSLAPLIADKLIDTTDIIVDGKTGLSGAGRTSLKLPFHFPEADEDTSAYAVGGHRHVAEMVQELAELAGGDRVTITFTPHLVPMSRGILTTSYVSPRDGIDTAALYDCFAAHYADEPFVHFLPQNTWPHTKWTAGTNHCFLAADIDEPSGRAIIVSAIDNLCKGYAGQMVQCLNLMIDADETTGLSMPAVYP